MMLEISTSGNMCVNHVAETCAEDLPDRGASSLRMDTLNRLVQEPPGGSFDTVSWADSARQYSGRDVARNPAARYSRDR